MTPAERIARDGTAHLARATPYGPLHASPAGGRLRSACPAELPRMGAGASREGPMYLDEALERDGVCGHCRASLERAREERRVTA